MKKSCSYIDISRHPSADKRRVRTLRIPPPRQTGDQARHHRHVAGKRPEQCAGLLFKYYFKDYKVGEFYKKHVDCDIRNSVTMSRYGIQDQVQGLTEYLCGRAAITILSVGRLTKQKNYPVIIEAINELGLKDIKYEIIGSGEDEEKLKQMATTECIQFCGTMEREKVLSWTAGADLI